jgi:hypothetical protein
LGRTRQAPPATVAKKINVALVEPTHLKARLAASLDGVRLQDWVNSVVDRTIDRDYPAVASMAAKHPR